VVTQPQDWLCADRGNFRRDPRLGGFLVGFRTAGMV
jgi:hypothetical protein